MQSRYIHATNPPTSLMLFFKSGYSRNACAPSTKVCTSNLSQGRIWWFLFLIPKSSNGSCCAVIGLSQHSYQVRFKAVLLIEAHSRKPDRAAPPEALKISLSLTRTEFLALVPWQSPEGINFKPPPKMAWNISNEVGNWVLHNNTEYVDDEGTINAEFTHVLGLQLSTTNDSAFIATETSSTLVARSC